MADGDETLVDPSIAIRQVRSAPDAFLRRELSGAGLFAGRSLVAIFGLLAIVVYLRWLPGWLQSQAALGRPAIAAASLTIVATLVWTALAILVFLRRSRDLFGLLLATGFLSFGVVIGTFIQTGAIVAQGRANPWSPPWPATILLIANALSLPWAFFFPDGRFVPRGTVALAAVWILLSLLPALGGPLPDDTPLGSTGARILILSLVASTVVAWLYRYRFRSSPVQRQQIKWAMLGGLVFVVVYLLVVPTGAILLQTATSSQALFFKSLNLAIFSAAVTTIPVALAIGIFRQGLLDIDVILNRTITYGALTVGLAIAFIAISGAANWTLLAVTGRPSELVLLASVVPVAIAFMPARARALRVADRFVSETRVETLLFVDLVSSTERAYAMGNRPWRELLEHFRATVRRCLKRNHGHEVDTTGDGFFATFEGPVWAIRCGHEIIDAVKPLDLNVRVGVHIGEVQVDGRYVEGANVHLAARVMSEAKSGEVLVSEAIRDLLAGSEMRLTDRGDHHLKGVPGDVRLYAALA